MRHDLPGVGHNLSNHAIVFVGLLQKPRRAPGRIAAAAPDDRVPLFVRPAGRAALDMYINVQCKTSWSPLGRQVANLAPTLLKPKARGRVSLDRAGRRGRRCVEFNFTGHELDLQRFMQGFRRAVEILAHEKVRAMSGVTFPVKFDDRLRRLNRISTREQAAERARRQADRPGAAARRPGLLDPGRPAGRSRTTLVEDDDALAEHIRQNVAGTFHPVGTCRMGAPNYREP